MMGIIQFTCQSCFDGKVFFTVIIHFIGGSGNFVPMKNPAIDKMRLDGGVVCLDFVNTVPDRKDGTDRDMLQSCLDLLYWARKAKVIDTASYSTLEKTAADKDRPAREFF